MQGDGDAMAAVQAILRYMYFGQKKIRNETCFIQIIKRVGTRGTERGTHKAKVSVKVSGNDVTTEVMRWLTTYEYCPAGSRLEQVA